MPRQNRVLANGEIVAQDWRGSLMGNRGILHDDEGNLGTARWKHNAWICCTLAVKKGGRKRKIMRPGRYTELFFWDEAAALAAGHRPCGECRKEAARRFKEAWAQADLKGRSLAQIDKTLHAARVSRNRKQKTYEANLSTLPDGVFVSWLTDEEKPLLKWKGRLWSLTAGGYVDSSPSGHGVVNVLTPKPTVEVLRAGYKPEIRME